jgi:serine/threonine protein kinase
VSRAPAPPHASRAHHRTPRHGAAAVCPPAPPAPPQLADFGLARLLGAAGDAPNDGGCAGTLTHLAPELFDCSSPVTAAIDVYAFGARPARRRDAAVSRRPLLRRGGLS